MLDTISIFVAEYLFIVPPIVLLTYFFLVQRREKERLFFLALFSLPLTFLLSRIASFIYENPRPFVVEQFTPLISHAPDNGFPSDHTLFVAAFASIATMVNRKLGALLWIIVFAVAYSRVHVGVHHIIDVLASMCIALFATFIVFRGVKHIAKVF